ncbi:MAG: hypothetical protein MJ238_01610 [Bacilli bacterium]|nr:hypothetical protein [Bacilli bacterium]
MKVRSLFLCLTILVLASCGVSKKSSIAPTVDNPTVLSSSESGQQSSSSSSEESTSSSQPSSSEGSSKSGDVIEGPIILI